MNKNKREVKIFRANRRECLTPKERAVMVYWLNQAALWRRGVEDFSERSCRYFCRNSVELAKGMRNRIKNT